MRFQVSAIGLACATLLAACGGGGGSEAGGAMQTISFPFPGGPAVALPPEIAQVALTATASSGGPVTYASNTPAVCTVSERTLSLLQAGECSVTASQAGFEGYAPTSERVLFVVPKRSTLIRFPNPGWQPLDTQPVALVAEHSEGLPITFTSSTPAVCSVSGSTMAKLADGICIITGAQQGTDIFASTSVVKNIPVGTASSPSLTFLSGYKDTSSTKEDGAVSGAGGSSLNGWWCNGWCDSAVSSDGSSYRQLFNLQLNPPTDGSWWTHWSQIEVYAPAVKELSKTGHTLGGLRIDAQAALKFNLAQNAEWFSTGNNAVNVELILGHYALKSDGKECNVTLRGSVKPGTAAATNYSVSLKDLQVSDACELTNLDPWQELQTYSIPKLKFSSANANGTVSSTPGTPNYKTEITLTGPITIQ